MRGLMDNCEPNHQARYVLRYGPQLHPKADLWCNSWWMRRDPKRIISMDVCSGGSIWNGLGFDCELEGRNEQRTR